MTKTSRPPIADSLSERAIREFFTLHGQVGYGFPEHVYARGMELRLTAAGLVVAREAPIELRLDGQLLGQFRADMIVEDRLILEFKAAPLLQKADFLQLRSYLRASGLHVGLLMLFGPTPEVRRLER